MVYPPNINVATAMLTIYRPWRDIQFLRKNINNLHDFTTFLNSKKAPGALVAQYARAKERYITNKNFLEPISEIPIFDQCHALQDADEDLCDVVAIASCIQQNFNSDNMSLVFDFGENFCWDQNNIDNILIAKEPATWLEKTC